MVTSLHDLKHGKVISMMIQDPPEPRSWFVRVLSSSPPSESDYHALCEANHLFQKQIGEQPPQDGPATDWFKAWFGMT